MSILTRRKLLASSPAIAAAVVIPAAAEAAPSMSPRELVDFHAAELAKAMQSIWPQMRYYHVDHELGSVLCSVGMRRGLVIGSDGVHGDMDRDGKLARKGGQANG